MIRRGEEFDELCECFGRFPGNLDAFAPIEQWRWMNPAKRQPAGDVAEGDIEVVWIFTDGSCDAPPAESSVFAEEVVIVLRRFHESILPATRVIGKSDSAHANLNGFAISNHGVTSAWLAQWRAVAVCPSSARQFAKRVVTFFGQLQSELR